MQIKTYTLLYLSSYLITIYCFSFDSYSFNYSPKPYDQQAYNLLELQPHDFLYKYSDDSSVLLSDSPSDLPLVTPSYAPYEIPSESPTETPSSAPSEAPAKVLSNKKIKLLDNILKLFIK